MSPFMRGAVHAVGDTYVIHDASQYKAVKTRQRQIDKARGNNHRSNETLVVTCFLPIVEDGITRNQAAKLLRH